MARVAPGGYPTVKGRSQSKKKHCYGRKRPARLRAAGSPALRRPARLRAAGSPALRRPARLRAAGSPALRQPARLRAAGSPALGRPARLRAAGSPALGRPARHLRGDAASFEGGLATYLCGPRTLAKKMARVAPGGLPHCQRPKPK